jgi:hypothetical protein
MRHHSHALLVVFFLLIAVLCIPSKATDNKSKLSLASYAKYTQIPGAKEVGPAACSNCHDVVAKNFQHAFHSQQGVECEQCPGQGSLHVDGGGDVSKIVAFSKRTPDEKRPATGSVDRTQLITFAAWTVTRFIRPH